MNIDLLDSEPLKIRLNRVKAELLLKALRRLDADDLARVRDLEKELEDGLAPPDMNDIRVQGKIQHHLFVAALHDLLGKIPGRWVVWLDGRVHSDHATFHEALDVHHELGSCASLVSRVEPLLGVCVPGGYFVVDEFKKYEEDWKHGWSYESEQYADSMGDFVPEEPYDDFVPDTEPS